MKTHYPIKQFTTPWICLGHNYPKHQTTGNIHHVYGEGPYCGLCSKIRMQEIEEHRDNRAVDDHMRGSWIDFLETETR